MSTPQDPETPEATEPEVAQGASDRRARRIEHYPPEWGPKNRPARQPAQRRHAKWTIGLVALAVVVALSITAIVLFNGNDTASSASNQVPAPTSGSSPTATTDATDSSVIASADDVGPVSIVTSDVTCQSFDDIQKTLVAAQSKGWNDRDASVPGSAWTPTQRTQYEAVGQAITDTIDAAVTLAKKTPHRVMRELYETYVAYGRAYADSLAQYQPADDFLARTSVAAFQSISAICRSVVSAAAQARAPGIPAVAPPTDAPTVGDPANPDRFLPQAGPTCGRWIPAVAALQAATQTWAALDPKIPESNWTPDQRATQTAVGPLLTDAANTVEAAGRGSGYPVFEDFATLAALYYRAYALAISSYTPHDYDLALAGLQLDDLIASACRAASG